MTKEAGQHVNRTELAKIIGVTVKSIDSWVRHGCPYDQAGIRGRQEWQFNTAHVIKWLRDRDRQQSTSEMRELQLRKLEAETVRAELDLAKAKGEVALIDDFERAQALVFAAIRTNVLNVPQRVVVQMLGETNETAFKEKLRAELAAALEQSAATQFSELTGDVS